MLLNEKNGLCYKFEESYDCAIKEVLHSMNSKEKRDAIWKAEGIYIALEIVEVNEVCPRWKFSVAVFFIIPQTLICIMLFWHLKYGRR